MVYSNSKFIVTLMLVHSVVTYGYCQTEGIDCSKYYARIDSASKDKIINRGESPIQIIGGVERINELLLYPKSALQNQIEGRVFVRFVIDGTGQMHCLQLISGIRKDFNEEALRVVKMLTFKPAIRNGKPITSSMFLPLIFQVETNAKKKR